MIKFILNWCRKNYREYILTGMLFLIGVFIGVLVINNLNDVQMNEICSYVEEFIIKFKSIDKINSGELIGTSIKNNLILVGTIWLAGTMVIGLPVVLTIIIYRGLCLGFTVAIFSYHLGKFGGIMFILVSLVMQSIIFIPSLFTLGVISIKLYKSIVKKRDINNIKAEIIRYTIISGIIAFLLIISALIENIISVPLLKNFIKNF